jgi:YihY family inner membrane protein
VISVARVDRYQQEHGWSGFPLAVAYKVFDDRAPYLAALVTYYALVSLFPLMLLFLAITGFVLDGHPGLRDQLITAAVDYFPAIGDQLRQNIDGFSGSGVALAVGVVGTLYGALGMMQAAQTAFNQMYGVPRNEQPNPFTSRLRSLGLVGLLGVALVASTVIASALSFADSLPWSNTLLVQVAGYALTWLLDVGLFTAGFQLLTARDLKIHNVLTGGLLAGSVFMLLQVFGSRLVSAQVDQGSALYGTFGVALAAIAFVYLQALAVMIAAEVNVVRHLRLWPRALLTPFTDDVELTAGDRRAYSLYAATQQFKGFETICADFTREP